MKCEALRIKPNTYYRWIKREEARRFKRISEQILINRIEQVFEDTDRTYGYRAIRAELISQGVEVSEYKIRRLSTTCPR